MNHLMEAAHIDHIEQARAIVTALPLPSYADNYQVPYEDEELLIDSVAENLLNPGVATGPQIIEFRGQTAAIGEGTSHRPVIITNSCAEEITDLPIPEVAVPTIVEISAIQASNIEDPIVVQRAGGQYVKPRSDEFEILPDGSLVESYKGPGINRQDAARRAPDPRLLVAGAIQARLLQQYLTQAYGGHHVLMAHELLSLPYDAPFVRRDETSGEMMLTSAHLPWGGVRTNAPDSAQNQVLKGIINTVGQKIGATSTPQHIDELAKTLNPNGDPGKIAFMIRTPADHYAGILKAIKERAEGSLVLFDIHGITKVNKRGEKIRYVGDIEAGIEQLAYACDAAGLALHGLHLETMTDARHSECVDYRDQSPSRKGNVDPRLNPLQTRRILDFAAAYLNR
jgi:3-deoxy-7-phosphoheptulonate synthase